MPTGLIIGRFQPFHSGHADLIKKALKEVDTLIIGVGSSQEAYTKRNPFSYGERRTMIYRFLRDIGLENKVVRVKRIPDINNNKMYIEHVNKCIGIQNIDMIYCGRDSERIKEIYANELHVTQFLENNGISGTYIRNEINEKCVLAEDIDGIAELPESAKTFLYGIDAVERIRFLFKNYKYENPIPVVDAVIRHKGKVVFVIRKNNPFKGKLAFPGGYVNKGETLRQAIKREVKEETGLEFIIKDYIGYLDSPDRDPRGHNISHIFTGVGMGKLKAGDDAKSVELKDEIELFNLDLAFDHKQIVAKYLMRQ